MSDTKQKVVSILLRSTDTDDMSIRLVLKHVLHDVDVGELAPLYDLRIELISPRRQSVAVTEARRTYYSFPQSLKTALTILQLTPNHALEGVGFMTRRAVYLVIGTLDELYSIIDDLRL